MRIYKIYVKHQLIWIAWFEYRVGQLSWNWFSNLINPFQVLNRLMLIKLRLNWPKILLFLANYSITEYWSIRKIVNSNGMTGPAFSAQGSNHSHVQSYQKHTRLDISRIERAAIRESTPMTNIFEWSFKVKTFLYIYGSYCSYSFRKTLQKLYTFMGSNEMLWLSQRETYKCV